MKQRITKFIEERVKFAQSVYSFFLFCLEFHHQDIHDRIDKFEKKLDDMFYLMLTIKHPESHEFKDTTYID